MTDTTLAKIPRGECGGCDPSARTLATSALPAQTLAMTRRPKIGLALGSGGARGWCHIGVLKGLAKIGIEPDVLAGTSIGAVVGAAWAGDRLEALEDWVRALTPVRFVGLMDLKLGSGGLVRAREIETILKEIGVAPEIEALGRPFAAIATDMGTGREIWFRDGPTYPAVRASAGIPGVMTPVHHDGRWLLDGGLVNPLPVSTARALGAEVTIAVNPNGRPFGRFWQSPEPKAGSSWVAHVLPTGLRDSLGLGREAKPGAPSYFDVLSASLDVMEDTIRRARLAGEPPHIQLDALLTDLPVLDLFRGAEAIAEGERLVAEKADRIREICLGN